MKIASFNVNGLRARIGIVTDWLRKENPSVLCLQETKVQDQDFPVQFLKDLSLHVAFRGQKSYNGVAIVSREKPEDVRIGLGDGEDPEEARFIAARIEGVWIVNTYVPQGTDVGHPRFAYKLEWLGRLKRFFASSPVTPWYGSGISMWRRKTGTCTIRSVWPVTSASTRTRRRRWPM